MLWDNLLIDVANKNFLAIARAISLVENEVEGSSLFLQQLHSNHTPILGITGPPGAGKSTLVDALVANLITQNKTIAILCIDPSSPFNKGALLGDRIRLSSWYNSPNIYIRSLATRGSLGGLHYKIIEITDILQHAAFDYIIIETVGVGQSEIEIAGLANTTIVTLVPEAGDEVQTMKAGLMEIADIFVVNKADRPEADIFVHNLKQMLAPVYKNTAWNVPIVKTIASHKIGITELLESITLHQLQNITNTRKLDLLTLKAYQLIQQQLMATLQQHDLKNALANEYLLADFNIYTFIKKYTYGTN